MSASPADSDPDGAVVRPMAAGDWPAVREIWAAGIAAGHATFETAPAADYGAFSGGKVDGLLLVAESAGSVVGWAAASPTSSRPAYRGVVEDSVYVGPEAVGRGIGSLLLASLLERSEAQGIWTVQGSIFPENEASLRLHAQHGFRVVGRRERIGFMEIGPLAGRWRDTLILERRSALVSV